MKKLLVFSIALMLYSCGQPGSTTDTSGLLDPKAFADKLKSDPEIILLDVRTPEEMQSGYITGARNINFNAEGFANSIDSLDRSKTYFVYCAAGKRSGKALDLMKEKGFQKVTSLDGGMNAWNKEELPVQKPN
ncbi:MAG: rhodanese-like domain-containing protein [Bacteroidota bacterium]